MERLHKVRAWAESNPVSALFVLSLLLVGAVTVRGLFLRMDRVLPARLPHHMYPAAISMVYHHGAPYVMYVEIQDRVREMRFYLDYTTIFSKALKEQTACNNSLLEEVTTTQVKHPERTRLLPGDDKGLVDIVILSLVLFGAHVQGMYYTVLLIILATVLVFFLAFRHRLEFCLVPVFVLGALFVTMPAFLLTHEMYSITNPRLFAILGLIPALHLMLIPFDRGHWSCLRVVCAAFQTLIIIECIHVRSSAVWLLFAVGGIYVSLLGVAFLQNINLLREKKCTSFAVVKSTWVLGLVIGSLGALKLYQQIVYDPGYVAALQHRYCWHNIAIGLSLHPRFAEKYELSGISDDDVQAWIKRSVSQERSEVIFGKTGEQLDPGAPSKNHCAYEEECRRVVLGALKEDPWAATQLVLYYKPLLALRSFSWASGLSSYNERRLRMGTQGSAIPDQRTVTRRYLHIRLPELAALGWFIMYLCTRLNIDRRAFQSLGWLFVVVTMASAIPALLVYPLLPVIGDCLVCASLLLLALTVILLTAVTQRFGLQ